MILKRANLTSQIFLFQWIVLQNGGNTWHKFWKSCTEIQIIVSHDIYEHQIICSEQKKSRFCKAMLILKSLYD